MVFGYARVSTMEQSLDLQLDALLKEGIQQKNIYTDKVSSTKEVRKSLSKLLKYVRDGDTIVVWKLDRLARSLIHFTNLMTRLKVQKTGIVYHLRRVKVSHLRRTKVSIVGRMKVSH
ncbi:recombinase family protein [Flagellimonas sp.]|uniref:recombinase family protein n=1 Tax=Flagellimonas sp. TaxID=2058762 RepID=UPI003AB8DC14